MWNWQTFGHREWESKFMFHKNINIRTEKNNKKTIKMGNVEHGYVKWIDSRICNGKIPFSFERKKLECRPWFLGYIFFHINNRSINSNVYTLFTFSLIRCNCSNRSIKFIKWFLDISFDLIFDSKCFFNKWRYVRYSSLQK